MSDQIEFAITRAVVCEHKVADFVFVHCAQTIGTKEEAFVNECLTMFGDSECVSNK